MSTAKQELETEVWYVNEWRVKTPDGWTGDWITGLVKFRTESVARAHLIETIRNMKVDADFRIVRKALHSEVIE